ncbi:MAG: GNAT family N-acetyltransferase [Finegoldia magna]|nr:GNAT family N-acetyltransferase [Finegoldia magna]
MIVKIGIDRIDEIVEFEDLCFSSDFWSREQIIDVLNDRRTIYLSYEENGKIIGEICLYNWCSEKDFLKIFSIATHPEHRNQGIAHELVKESIKIASSNKLKRIKAETRKSNFKMQKVFEDMNFRKTDIVENYYEDPDEDALIYEFHL